MCRISRLLLGIGYIRVVMEGRGDGRRLCGGSCYRVFGGDGGNLGQILKGGKGGDGVEWSGGRGGIFGCGFRRGGGGRSGMFEGRTF